MTLSVLASLLDLEDDFGFFGIIKETGVDDAGACEFAETYYPHQLYVNQDYSFYQALGDRKVGFGEINPIDIACVLWDSLRRITTKSIQGNFKGEGIVQGGIIFFGPDGKPKYAYEEETGQDLPVAELVTIFRIMKEEGKQQPVSSK